MSQKNTLELALVKTILSDDKAKERYLIRAARLAGCVAAKNMTRESAIQVLGFEISSDVIKAFRVLERLFTKLYYSKFEYVKNVFYKVVRPADRDSTARTLSILQTSVVSCIDYEKAAEMLYLIAEEKLPIKELTELDLEYELKAELIRKQFDDYKTDFLNSIEGEDVYQQGMNLLQRHSELSAEKKKFDEEIHKMDQDHYDAVVILMASALAEIKAEA